MLPVHDISICELSESDNRSSIPEEEKELFNRKTITGILKASLLGFFLTLSVGARANAMTVVLDPGHGGIGTTGAGALYPPYMEKSLNLSVANQVKSELEAAGITTYMTRTGDASLTLEQRASYAKSVNADLLVSIHFNSTGAHDRSGSEVWTSLYSNYYNTGYALGTNVLSQLTGLGFQNKGVKTKLGNSGDYYGIIRNGVALGIPTVIIEHCYMDNPGDRAIIDSQGPSGIGHADAAGIINYVNSVGGAGASLPKSAPVVFAEGSTTSPLSGATNVAAGSKTTTASTTTSKPSGYRKEGNKVIYTDPNGSEAVFTADEWSRLLGNWAYTGDPDFYIQQVPVGDLKSILGQ